MATQCKLRLHINLCRAGSPAALNSSALTVSCHSTSCRPSVAQLKGAARWPLKPSTAAAGLFACLRCLRLLCLCCPALLWCVCPIDCLVCRVVPTSTPPLVPWRSQRSLASLRPMQQQPGTHTQPALTEWRCGERGLDVAWVWGSSQGGGACGRRSAAAATLAACAAP